MIDDEELSHDARSLIAEAKGGDDPSPADRARIRRAVLATVAGGAGLAASTAASSAAASSTIAATTGLSLGAKILAAVIVVGAVGGGTIAIAPWEEAEVAEVRTERPRARRTEEPALAIEEPEPVVIAPVLEEPAAPEPVVEAPERQRPRARVVPAPEPVPPAVDGMAEIRELQAAMRARDPSTALALLAEHERRYPRSQYSEEREAQRVVALCGAGRREEARALAARFLREHPRSPQATRVRTACE